MYDGGNQIEDKQGGFEFGQDDDYELGTDRNNFYNLESNRGMMSKRGYDDGDGRNSELELKKLTKHS